MCSNCHKGGHKRKECLQNRLYFDDKNKNISYIKNDKWQIRCLLCGKQGHANCLKFKHNKKDIFAKLNKRDYGLEDDIFYSNTKNYNIRKKKKEKTEHDK